MSRAFVKEGQETEAAELPDRLVSSHPNYVTVEGLAKIEAEVGRLSVAYAAAQSSADRSALGSLVRDLRYWTARRASAEVVQPSRVPNAVRFGTKVTLVKPAGEKSQGGERLIYRIVGEDEAEPDRGTLSYVSPMARALMGKSPGDTIRTLGGEELEIVAIE